MLVLLGVAIEGLTLQPLLDQSHMLLLPLGVLAGQMTLRQQFGGLEGAGQRVVLGKRVERVVLF